ncbi:hypothetical protein [Haloarcula onubensis]|uniref:PglZ domain-containing protein n=1 Tax=Haloarcula onubensis TaxID=2950539 RepID=A0ABU2FLW0_9EURY|nr:hypothetical protein [Halomicroarcula sp. S3CR25-11]MDS0281742.1 hypothetical protein [Halomicroarcula sp. S3CR25-11]
MLGKTLLKTWQLFRASEPDAGSLQEPFPYRAWKWLWQQAPGVREPDLFDRLDAVDWDVLILLDACRYDTLADITTNAVVDRARSPASATPGFLSAANEARQFEETVYVSANPQSGKRSPSPNCEHVPVYETEWDDNLATVRAEDVYDAVRDHVGGDRPVVAHTLQPHYPHVCAVDGRTVPVPGGVHPRFFADEWYHGEKLQAMLANGLFDTARARRSYEACVRYAWERASEFAAELADDGHRVVISADHGELFGERGLVEHPVGVAVEPVVAVPWVVFEPETSVETPETVSDRLVALGYAEE